ncbi:MAG: DNA polymerase IV [Actinomycetota bacterium]|nr:DNA polymerase IV [Actinomycetota bacterium]MEC8521364.1 DNA polymerase IV [Actinomycetota bacterium]MEC9224073.1 DNA polymerase IV [Actinomycetota bacterium]MED5570859.1 DNA polymerase IV [Actinomycetota bacterium]
MKAQRSILHIDMNAFFVSVELLDRPDLVGKPVVVGASSDRGVVAAASYEARRFGVRSAMSGAEAKRRCPHLVALPPDHQKYSAMSARVRKIFDDQTSLVEPLALDEAFLDVTVPAPGLDAAARLAQSIRLQISSELGLGSSVGVATNKFIAKLASVDAKPVASPSGIQPGPGVVVVDAGTEYDYVQRLDVGRLWGVGPKSRAKLEKIGVRTVPELSAMPEEVLRAQLGEALTAQLIDLAHGRDERPVIPDREAKSIGHEETFGSDLADAEVLHAELVRMTDIVTSRIRSGVGGAKTWSIKVRLSDFTTLTRSHTWSIPIASTSEVIGVLDRLLEGAVNSRSVRLLGVSASGFGSAVQQLDLFSTANVEQGRRDDAIDRVRDRFGGGALRLAGSLRPERDENPSSKR